MTSRTWAELTKDHTAAAQRALDGFGLGQLPAGKDLVLGLKDDYAVAFGREVPSAVQSKVIDLCSDIRQHAADARRKQKAAAQ